MADLPAKAGVYRNKTPAFMRDCYNIFEPGTRSFCDQYGCHYVKRSNDVTFLAGNMNYQRTTPCSVEMPLNAPIITNSQLTPINKLLPFELFNVMQIGLLFLPDTV